MLKQCEMSQAPSLQNSGLNCEDLHLLECPHADSLEVHMYFFALEQETSEQALKGFEAQNLVHLVGAYILSPHFPG